MTADAACHAGDVGGLLHDVQQGHIAVAGATGHAGLQMSRMAPEDELGNAVDLNPRGLLVRQTVCCERLNRRLFFCDGRVATHAGCQRRIVDPDAIIRFRMAKLARQLHFCVLPVAEGNWLHGSTLLRSRRPGRILRCTLTFDDSPQKTGKREHDTAVKGEVER